MTTLYLAATGPRAADEVWERYAQPALWSTWAPQIRRVEVGVERLSGGESGRVLGPLGFSVDFEVESWDEAARHWAWSASGCASQGR